MESTEQSGSDSSSLKPDIVSNIPLHQAAPVPGEHHPDLELDKIMRDVGHQLHKESHKPAKKHHWFGSHESKREVKFAAQPLSKEHIPAPATHVDSVASKPVPAPVPNHTATHQASPARPAAKPKAKSSAPVMVIILTIIFTGVLIAAAVSAYKK